MEYGSVATQYVPKLYGEELSLCQRYFINLNPKGKINTKYGGIGYGNYLGTCVNGLNIALPVSLRTTPTLIYTGEWNLSTGNSNIKVTNMPLMSSLSMEVNSVVISVYGTVTYGQQNTLWSANDIMSTILFDAEMY